MPLPDAANPQLYYSVITLAGVLAGVNPFCLDPTLPQNWGLGLCIPKPLGSAGPGANMSGKANTANRVPTETTCSFEDRALFWRIELLRAFSASGIYSVAN